MWLGVAVERPVRRRTAGSVFLRCRRNGASALRGCRPRAGDGRPVSASRTTTSIGKQILDRQVEQPGLGASGGVSGRTGCVSAAAVTSPSPSMSSAPREPMCSTRPRTCAGQARAFGQRRSMSPSFAGASAVPHSGQCVGHDERALGAVAQLDDRARAPRGSRRPPCAARRCRRSARPWPSRRPGCAASPAAPCCRRPAPAP